MSLHQNIDEQLKKVHFSNSSSRKLPRFNQSDKKHTLSMDVMDKDPAAGLTQNDPEFKFRGIHINRGIRRKH